MTQLNFQPQEGKQRKAFDTKADVMIYGGAAGSGKSRLLLIKALKYAYRDPNFEGVLFRRTTKPLKSAGGLFSESKKLFSPLKPKVREKDMEILFNNTNGGNLAYTHLEHENDAEGNHQGLQYSFIGFDELTHFTPVQFNYLLGRMRSAAEGDSFCMATTNPDPDSWVYDWVEWYLDEKGFPDPEKDGQIRYFVTVDEKPVFANEMQTLIDEYPDLCYQENPNTGEKMFVPPMSFCFISGTIFDNPALISANPKYLSALKAQSKVNRMRLLDGNWHARPEGSNFFQREWLHRATMQDISPKALCIRAWDLAHTEPSDKNRYPDYTASIKMYKDDQANYYIVGDFDQSLKDPDTQISGRFRKRFGTRNKFMLRQAEYDYEHCMGEPTVSIPEESGAGKSQFEDLVKIFTEAGFKVKGTKVGNQKDGKLKRFSPFSSACQNGLVSIVPESFGNTATLEAFYKELESFDGTDSTASSKDDWVDVCSDCWTNLQGVKVIKSGGIAAALSHISTKRDNMFSKISATMR